MFDCMYLFYLMYVSDISTYCKPIFKILVSKERATLNFGDITENSSKQTYVFVINQ